ncbi:nitroreductase family protein [Ligilactobacillus apodemi]|uniref:nitroreductase family protein n=1 Tax=Ligilactobacillus apodemi TaxID=307126 RepID=UPI00214BB152|nr:nitroreductase family protein [Ligilactobacillus apodemi]MCR1901821.1 nitroreductase family protein [Ligilactobacillus apodemi]
MENTVVNDLKKRRSIYALGKNVTQTPAEISTTIKETIRQSPTAFNSQTVRAAILFGENSDKVWDIVAETLKEVVPAENFAATKEKIDSFKAGFGTILYFTDTATVKQLENDFPLYAENFGFWAEQALGGAQQAVWTALAAENVGASLQHYNPLIDEKIKEAFNIPDNWLLRAQMPFGSIEAPAGQKEFIPDSDRFLIFE